MPAYNVVAKSIVNNYLCDEIQCFTTAVLDFGNELKLVKTTEFSYCIENFQESFPTYTYCTKRNEFP